MKKNTVDMFTRIFKVLQPPPEMTLSQWADKFRRLSAGSSAEPGRWKTAKAPYQGKTDAMVLNPIGYYVHYDPSPIMVIQPTIDMAEKFSKEKLSPMLRDTPVLADRINEKSRNSGNTIMQKIFPGGFITIAGANSPTGLRSHTIRILLADEIDAYPASAGKEGDPLLLASAPCPCCGELQPLVWSNVVFDKNDLSEIRYACSKCGVISSEAEWKEHFIDGTFVHEDPDNPVRGFHLNTLASTLTTWQEVVEKFLTANDQMKKGNVELMKVWTNTEMGQTWEEDGETIEDDELMKRREKYKCEVPEEVLYLTAGVDTQDDRFEIEVVGWGPEYESWGIRYAAIYGDNSDINNQVWQDLDTFLLQTFEKPDGTKMKLSCVCIDSGGHRTNQVYKFCKARFNRRVFAIKGSNDSAAAYIQKPSKSNREGAYLFTLGVDTGKSLLMDRLKLEEEGPGFCHFPKEEGKGYDEKYFNEALDCRNYATAAIEIINVPLKKPDKKKDATQAKKIVKRGRRRSGGIL